MNADIKGALENINRSYRVFQHDGKPMAKEDVRRILEYGLSRGYDHTGQLSEDEINCLLRDEKCNCGEPVDPHGDGYCTDCA